jgi:tRNA(Glu) U13 pseudouridine synthase TruD
MIVLIQQISIYLSFVLPKSCYATMAVKCLYRVGRVSGEATEQES